MKKSIQIFSTFLATLIFLTSCEKKVAPIDDYGVTVEFKNSGGKFLSGDVQINPKDSIFFDFTITSSMDDMAVIEIQKNSGKIDTFNVTGANKRVFSGVKKYMADSAAGNYSYRILARNSQGVYLGDGNKLIIVTVNSDFNFYSYKTLYAPDSVLKVNKNFYSTINGATFSYAEGATNGANIDFGYFYDTTTSGAPKHTIYALTANAFLPHDLSSWTKNATIFKKVTTPSFSTLTSGGALRSAGIANLASGTSAKAIQLAAGNLILFKTAAGKYGCIQINYIDGANASPSTFINIDVKVQK